MKLFIIIYGKNKSFIMFSRNSVWLSYSVFNPTQVDFI